MLQILRDSLSTALQNDTLTVRLVDTGSTRFTSVPDWLRWAGEFISQMAWPLIVSGAVLYFVFSPTGWRRLARLFKPFRSFKLFGAEFVLSEEAAKELGTDAEEAFATYRKRARREYDQLVEVYDLRSKLEAVLFDSIEAATGPLGNIKDFRCTIHVRDILFSESLYQLLDYYPRGAGRGRVKSFRFGIIGKVWRSGNSLIQGGVSTDPGALILDWGMTREEAAAAGVGRKSFGCVLLRDTTNSPLGLFYMDATGDQAFGAPDKAQPLIDGIVKGCKDQGLTEALASITHELRRRGPMIVIYD